MVYLSDTPCPQERIQEGIITMNADQIIEPPDSEVRDLLKSVEAAFSIECIPCGNEETVIDNSEWSATKKFWRGGWRIVENEAWCEECVESAEGKL
jgi:hypothetical protein